MSIDPSPTGVVVERGGAVTDDTVDKMIRYENGEMDDFAEVLEFFQDLIDTGLAWSLQGSYGRQAQSFIDDGYCTRRQ